MIRFLRVVGVTNAAVWFGAAVFYTLFVAPGLKSDDVQAVLQLKYFPYFSGAIGQVILMRYFYLNLICAVVALLHLFVERLYLGRAAHTMWTSLLVTLLCLALLGSFWLGPELGNMQKAQFRADSTALQRENAIKSYRKWSSIFLVTNVFVIGGVAVLLWRATTPSDELRFVGSGKFRG